MRASRVIAVSLGGYGLLLGGISASQATPDYRYTYVPLDSELPAGYAFFNPVAISNDGSVYGNAYRCTLGGCVPSVAKRSGNKIAVLVPGAATNANDHGVVSGYVSTDPRNGVTQAALFRGRNVQRLPRRDGETSSKGQEVTNSGIALVNSSSTSGNLPYLRRPNGAITDLDFDLNAFFLSVNSKGVVSGSTFSANDGAYRAFRFRAPATQILLDPTPTETQSWGLAINSRGDVLGYSFEFGATERIGFWRGRSFHTQFVEGTAEYPTVSNYLLWNERGLIVITDTTDLNSYIVPAANVRLNLGDITNKLPPWTSIYGVNENGDIVGIGGPDPAHIEESFLLKRRALSSLQASARTAWAPSNQETVKARQAAAAMGFMLEASHAKRSQGARKHL